MVQDIYIPRNTGNMYSSAEYNNHPLRKVEPKKDRTCSMTIRIFTIAQNQTTVSRNPQEKTVPDSFSANVYRFAIRCSL